MPLFPVEFVRGRYLLRMAVTLATGAVQGHASMLWLVAVTLVAAQVVGEVRRV